jgi:L-fuconolactonase
MTAPTLHRRQFLTASAKAVAGLALANAVPLLAEKADFAVVDAHIHLYDPTRPQGVPWPPRDDKFLYRPALLRNYRALSTPRPVTGAIVVEASPWLEDNQWVLDLCAHEPFIVGFVGNLPAGDRAFAGHLKHFSVNKLFRGIRLRDRTLEESFFPDLKLLADHALSLDLAGGLEILPFARRLAEVLPSLRIIIDHLAGIPITGKAPPSDWSEQIQTLARHQNIYCKLSGLVEGTGRGNGSAPRDVEFYRPVLNTMRSLFGAERLIYASDWPVSERFAPLATVQGIVQEYFRSYGRAEEEMVFSQSAKMAYRLR